MFGRVILTNYPFPLGGYFYNHYPLQRRRDINKIKERSNEERLYWVMKVDQILKEKEIPFEISYLILNYTIAPRNVNFFAANYYSMWGCEGVIDKKIRQQKQRRKLNRWKKAEKKKRKRAAMYEAYKKIQEERMKEFEVVKYVTENARMSVELFNALSHLLKKLF